MKDNVETLPLCRADTHRSDIYRLKAHLTSVQFLYTSLHCGFYQQRTSRLQGADGTEGKKQAGMGNAAGTCSMRLSHGLLTESFCIQFRSVVAFAPIYDARVW